MYTTLEFLVVLNARRFIVGASPELKFRTIDEADAAGKRVTDSSQAVIYLFSRLRSTRHVPRVQSQRATLPILNHIATDVFITPCLSPFFFKGCKQGKNNVALINFTINFGYE